MSDINQKNKPIRVLQVIHILDRGGVEAMIMNLYRKVDRSRIQFDFLVHSPKRGFFEDEIESYGGRVFRIEAFKGFNLIRYYNECLKFFRAHPEIQIVHGHLGSCAAYYLHAAKRCGMFAIAHSHSAGCSNTIYGLSYKIFSYPARWVADHFFGCSTEAGKDRYGSRVVRSERYRNFNNAVDTARFVFSDGHRSSLRKELGIDSNTIVLGTVGRVTVPKNPLRIYSIFKEIVNREPGAICLWVGTGEMEGQIKQLIARDALEDKIIMTGVRSDIPAVMSALDCMVFPSLWEGLPVSVIESQMANLPCVLSTNISRETQISDLLSWHDLSEPDAVWATDAINLAKQYCGTRDRYSFSPADTGYDIDTTTKELMQFYENHVVDRLKK